MKPDNERMEPGVKSQCRLIIGCGYLGQRVAACWLAAGDQVYALTRSAERANQLRASGIEPLIGDVTLPASLQQLPEVDSVLHAVGYDRSAEPSKRQVYVAGLENVLTALKGRCRRFVQISSTSVYGQSHGEIVDETSPCEPTEESGCICRDAEQLVMSTASAFMTNILRLSGIYGPGRLLSRVDQLKSGTPLPGSPDAWLNLIHVDDAATSVLICSERGAPGRTYLVSDDRPVLRREYYGLLAKLVGAAAPNFAPDAVARHMHGLNKRCNNQVLRHELRVELAFPTIDVGLPASISPQ